MQVFLINTIIQSLDEQLTAALSHKSENTLLAADIRFQKKLVFTARQFQLRCSLFRGF